MAKVRPTREASEEKLLGKYVLAFLNYGESATYENPIWALIGGQRSADYSATADEIDLTDKTDGGYGDTAAGVKATELTLELIVKPQDETVSQLFDAQDDDEPVDILRWAKNGRSIRNWYSIISIEETASYEDACVVSVTLRGKGKPVYIEQMEDPREA
jgi:predicted secreted protein